MKKTFMMRHDKANAAANDNLAVVANLRPDTAPTHVLRAVRRWHQNRDGARHKAIADAISDVLRRGVA